MNGLALVLLSCLVTVQGVGPRCNACAGVPKMEDCSHTITCGDNEECFTRKTVGTVGNVMYQSGCISKQVCSLVGRKRDARSKRDSVNCFKCCNGDLCNRHLCSHSNNSSALECFACNDVEKPEECTELKSCGADYECSTVKYMLTTNNELRYKLDCMRKIACDVSQTANTEDGYCVRCCTGNYCNTKLCGFLDEAKPILSEKPQDRVVNPGDKVVLKCQVIQITGLPSNITWTHQNAQNVTTNPLALPFNNNQMLSMIITSDHYGYWTCRARNKNGHVEHTIKISPPVFIPGK